MTKTTLNIIRDMYQSYFTDRTIASELTDRELHLKFSFSLQAYMDSKLILQETIDTYSKQANTANIDIATNIERYKITMAQLDESIESGRQIILEYYPKTEKELLKDLDAVARSITFDDIYKFVLKAEVKETIEKLASGELKLAIDEMYSITASLTYAYFVALSIHNFDIEGFFKTILKVIYEKYRYTQTEAEEFIEYTERTDIAAYMAFLNGEDIKPKNKKPVAPIINKPINFSALNSKVANNISCISETLFKTKADGQIAFNFVPIQEQEEQDNAFTIQVGTDKKKKQEVVTLVSLSYEGELEYNRARITPFDENVLNTICSILQAGNNQMTLNDIARTMKGNPASDTRASKEVLEKIKTSIRKLAGTRVYIDLTNELNGIYDFKGDERLAKGIVDTMILSYTGFEAVTVAGKETYVLKLTDTPILYAYSKAKNELVTFETKLLDVPIHETEEMGTVKFYLLKNIKLINKGMLKNRIKYSTIYEKCGINIPVKNSKQVKARYRDYIKRMLEFWQQEGFIKGFSEYKDGREVTGIEIKS